MTKEKESELSGGEAVTIFFSQQEGAGSKLMTSASKEPDLHCCPSPANTPSRVQSDKCVSPSIKKHNLSVFLCQPEMEC